MPNVDTNPQRTGRTMQSDEEAYKKAYYDKFAAEFDNYNIQPRDEHSFALFALEGFIDFLGIESILDVGSGTGRTLLHLQQRKPNLKACGIEPSDGMRARAVEKGVALEQLVSGDATKLPFQNGAFDLVTTFGVLHHIRDPEIAIEQMLRVAKKAVFISDSNNMGQGTSPARLLKRTLTKLGLWSASYWLWTGGKGYWTSPHDGLAYSFSILNHRKQIENSCQAVHYLSTQTSGPNLIAEAAHVAVLGIKRDIAFPKN